MDDVQKFTVPVVRVGIPLDARGTKRLENRFCLRRFKKRQHHHFVAVDRDADLKLLRVVDWMKSVVRLGLTCDCLIGNVVDLTDAVGRINH